MSNVTRNNSQKVGWLSAIANINYNILSNCMCDKCPSDFHPFCNNIGYIDESNIEEMDEKINYGFEPSKGQENKGKKRIYTADKVEEFIEKMAKGSYKAKEETSSNIPKIQNSTIQDITKCVKSSDISKEVEKKEKKRNLNKLR